jgi:hypothetical protein
MTSQAVRARNVVEEPGTRHGAADNRVMRAQAHTAAYARNPQLLAKLPPSCARSPARVAPALVAQRPRGVVVALVSFALASLSALIACGGVQRAVHAAALATSTDIDVERSITDDDAAFCTPILSLYRNDRDDPSPGKLKAVERDSSEEDAGLDGVRTEPALVATRIFVAARKHVLGAAAGLRAQLLTSSALARGPPVASC